jgi:hypothetical protein
MVMISVYFSARLARRDELKKHRDELVAAGIECTARWLDGEPTDLVDIADMDKADVMRADVLVTFTDPPSDVIGIVFTPDGVVHHVEPGSISEHPWAHRGGRHVEFGIAWGLGKVAVVCGPRENFAHHARDVRVCADWAETLELLTTIASAQEIGLDAAEAKAIALTYGDGHDGEEHGW